MSENVDLLHKTGRMTEQIAELPVGAPWGITKTLAVGWRRGLDGCATVGPGAPLLCHQQC